MKASPSPDSTYNISSRRSLHQLGLFVAGAGCFALSMAFTRRSISRRYRNNIPRFFHYNNHGDSEVNGAMEALVALNLATINVCTAGMMTAGGMLWALDVSSLDDMKLKARRNFVDERILKEEEEDGEEIESLIASLLSRKEFRILREENDIAEEKLQSKIKGHQKEKDDEPKDEIKKP
ncbi:hypothetical protein K3495_g9118 [Podosphaera aphanis]|nr:hypothetical protein K3495_g9118 [Podosphaera aphanis]